MLRLVVACGGGIFTTTVVTDRIKEILRKERIQHSVTPHKITEIAGIMDADLIIVTGKTSATNRMGIPIMLGMALFTGVGESEFIEEFLKKVKEIEGSK